MTVFGHLSLRLLQYSQKPEEALVLLKGCHDWRPLIAMGSTFIVDL